MLAEIAANVRWGKKTAVISLIAPAAICRVDALFSIERSLNERTAAKRLTTYQRQSARHVADLESYLRDRRARSSRSSTLAEPNDYLL